MCITEIKIHLYVLFFTNYSVKVMKNFSKNTKIILPTVSINKYF